MLDFINLRKRLLLLLTLTFLLAAIPLTLLLLNSSQDIRQHAADNSTTYQIATINGKSLTRKELLSYAGSIFKTPPTDQATLQKLKENLIEKKLIEKAAQDNNLTVNHEEITLAIQRDNLTQLAGNPEVQEEARLSVLKQKIEKRFTKTRDAYTVGFWIPTPNYPIKLTASQSTLVAQQRKDAPEALALIEKQMMNGDDPLTIAKNISQQFPSLRQIIAVNGYLLDTTTNQSAMQQPMTYVYQKDRANVAFFKSLFQLNPNQTKTVRDKSTSDGGVVIRVISSSNGSLDNYQDWLSQQKSQFVR